MRPAGKRFQETKGSPRHPQKYFREESAYFRERAAARSSWNSKLCENCPAPPSTPPHWVWSETTAKGGVKVMKKVERKRELFQDFPSAGVMAEEGKPSQNVKLKVDYYDYYAGYHTLTTTLRVTRGPFVTHK